MSTYDLLIQNGKIVTENAVSRADVAILDGRIAELDENISPEVIPATKIDAAGLYIFPAVVDTHVHFNEPGRKDWEGVATGSRSLAAGGAATFFDMPLNSSPPVTTSEAFEAKQQVTSRESVLDYGLWGGLVPGNISSLEWLHEHGAVGFKAFLAHSGLDEFPYVDDLILMAGMEKIAALDSILAVHAESEVITNRLASRYAASGHRSARDYCASRPVASEIEAVGRATSYAEVTGCKLHVVHASSGQVVQRVNEARRRGVDVTVETCPHYLALTEEDFERIGPVAKCAPPLRREEHVESLWEALSAGEVDIIGSDHSPCPSSMKRTENGDMFDVWGGISGAQSTLNVLLEEGCFKRQISLEIICRVAATSPARRFGIYPRKGTITIGSDADLALVNLDDSFRLEQNDLLYRHTHSPYVGRNFRGRVVRTLSRGHTVFEKDKVVSQQARGQRVAGNA